MNHIRQISAAVSSGRTVVCVELSSLNYLWSDCLEMIRMDTPATELELEDLRPAVQPCAQASFCACYGVWNVRSPGRGDWFLLLAECDWSAREDG